MKRNGISCLLSVCLAALGLHAEETSTKAGPTLEPRIIHSPVRTLRENEKFVVEARVDGATVGIVYMRLYFKNGNADSYDYVAMNKTPNGYYAELAARYFSPPELHYFILALMSDQKVVTYPAWNPFGQPNIVTVGGRSQQQTESPKVPAAAGAAAAAAATTAPSAADVQSFVAAGDTDLGNESPILILSPEPGAQFDFGEEVVIAASFNSGDQAIEVPSINVFVDGLNVTLEAEISENLLTFATSGLRAGEHIALIQGHYASGAAMPSASWKFVVRQSQQRTRGGTANVSGRVYAGSRQERISSIRFSDNNIGGQAYGTYGKMKYDARLFLTSRESARFQPRHRFSLGVEMPWFGITVGDTYPRFNDLMLWGKRVRGIYGGVHFGFFNFDVVYGETVRRVSAQYIPNIAGLDSAVVSFGTHKQKLLGIRPSFGRGGNFQLAFNLLKVRDDTTSLDPGEFTRAPRDNLVVGSDLYIGLANRRFEIRGTVASSLFSNDISTGPASKQDLEDQYEVDLPFDPASFGDWLIINTSTTPLDPRELTGLSYHLNVRAQIANNNLQAGYKRIGSEYQSLGMPFLRSNIRGFYIYDNVRFANNMVYLNLGFEHFEDNFKQENDNPPTKLRTFNTGLSLFPGRGLPNLTFNLRTHFRDNGVDSLFVGPAPGDTTDIREDNLTRDLTVQLNQQVRFQQTQSTVTLSYVNSNRSDQFRSLSENSTNVGLVSVRTQYQVPLITTIDFAMNDNNFAGGLSDFKFNVFGIKGEYMFLDRRLRTELGFNVTGASGSSTLNDTTQSITDYSRLDFNLGIRYEFTSGHYFFIDGHLIPFNDNGGTFDSKNQVFLNRNPSFRDYIFRIYYEKRF